MTMKFAHYNVQGAEMKRQKHISVCALHICVRKTERVDVDVVISEKVEPHASCQVPQVTLTF